MKANNAMKKWCLLLWRVLLGFDTKAIPVEILYNEFGENGVNVFHAMPCRDQYLYLFEEVGMP